MESSKIQEIAKYSDNYVREYLREEYSHPDELLEDWHKSLEFFFGHCFYQGRSDNTSSKVDDAARKVFNKYKEEMNDLNSIFDKENRIEIELRLSKVIGKEKGKAGKGNDFKMLISILDFISDKNKRNLVKYSIAKIKNGKLADIYEEIDGIFSIGPKCSSFFLRDVVIFYSLFDNVRDDELIYLQPIDIWVARVANDVGIITLSEKEKEKMSQTIQKKYEIIRKNIVSSCLEINISPTAFNTGAWYKAYNSPHPQSYCEKKQVHKTLL